VRQVTFTARQCKPVHILDNARMTAAYPVEEAALRFIVTWFAVLSFTA
jgi:hypothetical protein